MENQVKRKLSDIPFEKWESSSVENYSQKFIDDYYVDAVTDLAKGSPFCMEVCVVQMKYWFKRKIGVEFKCVVKIFQNNQDLFDYVNEYGDDRLVEVFYADINSL